MNEAKPHLFTSVPERNTGDVILRTAQQHHVQLSQMADLKANIIITVSSIVLTMTLARVDDPALRLSAITLVVFTTLALLLAILAVLPKYRPLRLRTEELPPHFNLLFFGHFAELSRLEHGSLHYPLHELTSSGLTHAYDSADEPNRLRVGAI